MLEIGSEEDTENKDASFSIPTQWYDKLLPQPPVPSLEHTLERYLQYAKVVCETLDIAIEDVEMAVSRFFPIAEQLQIQLKSMAESEDNWINKFWLAEMYLKQRYALPVNSNPAYIFPRQHFEDEDDQIDYAAWLVRGFVEYKDKIDRKTIAREMSTSRAGNFPMCMAQCDRILSCYREPRLDMDVMHDRKINPDLYTDTDNEHVVVMCNRQAFVVFTRLQNRLLSQDEIYEQLVKVCQKSGNRNEETVVPVGGATVGNRDEAARFWQLMTEDDAEKETIEKSKLLSTIKSVTSLVNSWLCCFEYPGLKRVAIHSILGFFGALEPTSFISIADLCLAELRCLESVDVPPSLAPVNIVSLNWIRSAAFVLCLDRSETLNLSLSGDRLNHLENAGLQILHGFGSYNNGLNRWYDATIQLIVTRTGFSGLCIEHSVAEGIVIINMAESALRFAEERKGRRKNLQPTKLDEQSPPPKPLSWLISDEARAILSNQIVNFDNLAKELQLKVLVFDEFGKNLIKSLCFGPDGFVQLCMQLAHFRLHGYLVSTYESATLRKFRQGRVDNIRAATPEALLWVKAMLDPAVHKERRKELFREAARKQALITQENVNGDGIDNHLCALEVLTKQAVEQGVLPEMPELFRQKVWSELMRFPLSTSQVTTCPDFKDCYLCYGPVVEDGYGCAYNIQPDKIIFAPSAYKSNMRTDITGFVANLAHALRDTKQLFQN